MAIIKKGLLGGFSGKVGPVVGYRAMGQDLMRSKAKPRTSPAVGKELYNRNKFRTAHQWLLPLIDFLRLGFQDYAPTFAGFVAAKSYLLRNAFTGKYPNQVFNPALTLLSYGTLDQSDTAEVSVPSADKMILRWSGGEYEYNERCMYVIYHPESTTALFETAGNQRRFGKATIRLPKYLSGQNVLVYLAFTTDDRKNRSKSQFLGEFTIPQPADQPLHRNRKKR